jgi:hypothetical protein
MDIKEIGINKRNEVESAQDRGLLESPGECGIEPPCSISHDVSSFIIIQWSVGN